MTEASDIRTKTKYTITFTSFTEKKKEVHAILLEKDSVYFVRIFYYSHKPQYRDDFAD